VFTGVDGGTTSDVLLLGVARTVCPISYYLFNLSYVRFCAVDVSVGERKNITIHDIIRRKRGAPAPGAGLLVYFKYSA
jgi:hypothetical protein